MSVWSAILLAACLCVALKAFGYLIPTRILEAPRPARISDLLTVALLAALVAVQTLGNGQAVVVDARVPAVLVAGGRAAVGAAILPGRRDRRRCGRRAAADVRLGDVIAR